VGEGTVFVVADAKAFPFESDLFDAALIESVATFIEDKNTVVTECARVTRPGGYVGFNEEVWLKSPPQEMLREAHRAWEIRPSLPSLDEWQGFLEGAGLVDVKVRVHRFDWLRESSQIWRYRLSDMVRMLRKTLGLYARNPAFRQYMSRRKRLPRDIFDYLGYALLVGRKQ
jgi:SAM-dependent methyltransferase